MEVIDNRALRASPMGEVVTRCPDDIPSAGRARAGASNEVVILLAPIPPLSSPDAVRHKR